MHYERVQTKKNMSARARRGKSARQRPWFEPSDEGWKSFLMLRSNH